MSWYYGLVLYLLIGFMAELGLARSFTIAEEHGLERGFTTLDPRLMRLLAIFAWPLSVLWGAYILIKWAVEAPSVDDD